ncbi:carboxymuconolactone decarboxylase family protein [Streptomyces nigrescens]
MALRFQKHYARFAPRVGLTAAHISSLTHGTSADACWTTERDRLLLDAADALHTHHDIDDTLWERLSAEFSPEQLLDLLTLCGWYHAISFTARATRLTPEPDAPKFHDFPPPAPGTPEAPRSKPGPTADS